jgi:hypothetical protein
VETYRQKEQSSAIRKQDHLSVREWCGRGMVDPERDRFWYGQIQEE